MEFRVSYCTVVRQAPLFFKTISENATTSCLLGVVNFRINLKSLSKISLEGGCWFSLGNVVDLLSSSILGFFWNYKKKLLYTFS